MLGIIGGTGVYSIEGLEIISEEEVTTPYGSPSAPITNAKYGDREIVFLPRHGKNHELMPHEVNYRANIYALKAAGVTQIIGISAVGSLREEIKPGDFAIPEQYFDWTKGTRDRTFFGEGIAAHISTAEPTCPTLTNIISKTADKMQITMHTGKTYGCVEGPRLGTKAESHFLRNAAGCDLVGMTNIPEAFLAREAQICYCTIAISTDYDCWRDNPDEHVTVAAVIARYGESLTKAKSLLKNILEKNFSDEGCKCRKSLSEAVLTPEDALSPEKKLLLELLKE